MPLTECSELVNGCWLSIQEKKADETESCHSHAMYHSISCLVITRMPQSLKCTVPKMGRYRYTRAASCNGQMTFFPSIFGMDRQYKGEFLSCSVIWHVPVSPQNARQVAIPLRAESHRMFTEEALQGPIEPLHHTIALGMVWCGVEFRPS